MALAFLFSLLAQRVPCVGEVLDADTLDRMQQREVYLREQMAKLLKEVEQRRTDARPSRFFAVRPWLIWALAVLLLFLVFRYIRDRYRERQERMFYHEMMEMWEEYERELRKPVCHGDPDDITYTSRFYPEFSIWPLKSRTQTCKVVAELVDELLNTCQIVPKSYFLPRPQPAIGVGVGFEGSGPQGCYIVYRMLVPLKAPPGHIFHLEVGPKARRGVRNSRIRVEFQCTCIREQQFQDMLCFLHHPADRLRKKQMPSLLQTLCTDCHLDMEKTAAWFQELVKAAWALMPVSNTTQLELLPSKRHCKLKLTTTSGKVLWIELLLGTQKKDSDTFLTFE